jgi:hypothetical protein
MTDPFAEWIFKALHRHTELASINGHCLGCGMTLYEKENT